LDTLWALDMGFPRPERGMNAYSIFFGFLHGMQFSINNVTSSVALNTLKNTKVVHKYICWDVIGYVCYDLATQNYDRHLIYRQCSRNSVSICYGPKRLMRLILFSFAYMLSTQQRKAIVDSLSRKLHESGVELYGHEEYFQLLNIVDNLQSSVSQNTCDSHFMYVIESSVDLLVNMVSEKASAIQEKISILMMILEARFLLRTASCAYETIITRAQADDLSFKRDYSNLIKDILRADITLRQAIDHVCDYSVLDNAGMARGLRLFHSALRKIHSCYDQATLGSSSPPIEYIGTIFRQAENIHHVCTHLLEDMMNNKKIAFDTSAWINYEMSKVFSEDELNRSKFVVWICLHSHKQIVFDAYRLVENGAPEVFVALQEYETRNKELLPAQQITSIAPVLCSRIVARHAKNFLQGICGRSSRRVLTTPEEESMGAVQFMLFELCYRSALLDYAAGNFFARSQAHEKVLRNLAANICINIALGDTRHIFGESAETINLNFRVFALYTSTFCDLPPDMMNGARIKLKKAFDEHGTRLPSKIDDTLCILTDLKAFSYKSSYTGSCKHYAHDTENVYTSCYKANKDIAIDILETSARLLVHSASGKKVDSTRLRHVVPHCICTTADWLSVLRMLLYECHLMCAVSSVLSCKVAASSRSDLLLQFGSDAKSIHHEVLAILTGEKLCTTDKLAENKVEIQNAICESMKKIGELLEQNFVIEKKDTKIPIKEPCVTLGALYDSVWNADVRAGKTDIPLIAYVLCRSYVSIRSAYDIVDSVQQKSDTYSEHSLSDILRDYFLCDKIGSRKTIGAIGRIDGFADTSSAAQYVERTGRAVRFEAEEVSNSLNAVDIDRAAASPHLSRLT
ncbi:MAG: hypothetical protein AB8U44_04390, partial [Aaplasma endosymbiont of Hyalomma asiaticum]